MSLAEELTVHRTENYCDFSDGEHNIAVFGLGVNALLSEVAIEAVAEIEEPAVVEAPAARSFSAPVSLS